MYDEFGDTGAWRSGFDLFAWESYGYGANEMTDVGGSPLCLFFFLFEGPRRVSVPSFFSSLSLALAFMLLPRGIICVLSILGMVGVIIDSLLFHHFPHLRSILRGARGRPERERFSCTLISLTYLGNIIPTCDR